MVLRIFSSRLTDKETSASRNPDVSKLSIVVGTYNRRSQLVRLVESIERETTTSHILYIDDAGSDDGTIQYLKSIASDVIRPTFSDQRLGQARAYNAMFEQVETPYVCWLSDDNEIVNNSLDLAVDILESESRIGMVGLKVKDMQGPHVGTSYIGAVSSIGILNVNQGVLRTEILKELGGFNEALVDYGIDPDLTARVLYRGCDIVYTRDIAVRHYRNWGEDNSSETYRAIEDKRDKGIAAYERIHGGGDRSKENLAWILARQLFARPLNLSINSETRLFGGAAPRDFYNAMHTKHISVFDPLFTWGKPYHLRQRMSSRPAAARHAETDAEAASSREGMN